jgi:hypothetical protein
MRLRMVIFATRPDWTDLSRFSSYFDLRSGITALEGAQRKFALESDGSLTGSHAFDETASDEAGFTR